MTTVLPLTGSLVRVNQTGAVRSDGDGSPVTCLVPLTGPAGLSLSSRLRCLGANRVYQIPVIQRREFGGELPLAPRLPRLLLVASFGLGSCFGSYSQEVDFSLDCYTASLL